MDWKKVLWTHLLKGVKAARLRLKIAVFENTHAHIHGDDIALQQDGVCSEEQKDAAQVESYVVQRYIENPYLINGDVLKWSLSLKKIIKYQFGKWKRNWRLLSLQAKNLIWGSTWWSSRYVLKPEKRRVFCTVKLWQRVWIIVCTCVLQYAPLKAWLYRDGFARFSNTRFSLSTIDDICILSPHLHMFAVGLSRICVMKYWCTVSFKIAWVWPNFWGHCS